MREMARYTDEQQKGVSDVSVSNPQSCQEEVLLEVSIPCDGSMLSRGLKENRSASS